MNNGTSHTPKTTMTANAAGMKRTRKRNESAPSATNGRTIQKNSGGNGMRKGIASSQGSNRAPGTIA